MGHLHQHPQGSPQEQTTLHCLPEGDKRQEYNTKPVDCINDEELLSY